jgi:hypothetical protein
MPQQWRETGVHVHQPEQPLKNRSFAERWKNLKVTHFTAAAELKDLGARVTPPTGMQGAATYDPGQCLQ